MEKENTPPFNIKKTFKRINIMDKFMYDFSYKQIAIDCTLKQMQGDSAEIEPRKFNTQQFFNDKKILLFSPNLMDFLKKYRTQPAQHIELVGYLESILKIKNEIKIELKYITQFFTLSNFDQNVLFA